MVAVHIISLFPDICKPYFEHSIIGRAVENGILDVHYYNPIDEVPKLKRVDSRPYGGGPGMVLQAEPLLRAYDKAAMHSGTKKAVFFTPGGDLFTQERAIAYATYDNLIFLCGHYEGMDERVAEATGADRISVGPYTLTGGEIPAMLIADAVARRLVGVLGNEHSCEDARIAGSRVYTRPETVRYDGKEYTVPEVLRSGHHAKIDAFRIKQ